MLQRGLNKLVSQPPLRKSGWASPCGSSLIQPLLGPPLLLPHLGPSWTAAALAVCCPAENLAVTFHNIRTKLQMAHSQPLIMAYSSHLFLYPHPVPASLVSQLLEHSKLFLYSLFKQRLIKYLRYLTMSRLPPLYS